MNDYLKLTLLAMAILLTGCDRPPENSGSNRFAGLYKLHIMEQQDPVTGTWKEWRDGMQGYILYDDQDHMAVHLTTKGYENTDLRFPNFNDTIPTEALKHLTGSYVYFAKYTVDEELGVVEHARISHSNPGMWNEVVKRRFTFSGDTLILQPVEQANSALRLKWIRQTSGGEK